MNRSRCELSICVFRTWRRRHDTRHIDRRTNAFQLNSPSTGASKFCVPLECDVAIVFARLFVDAVDKGIHAFLVPVRLADKSVAPGVRFGELATTGGAPPGLRCGWLRFYDMPLSRSM